MRGSGWVTEPPEVRAELADLSLSGPQPTMNALSSRCECAVYWRRSNVVGIFSDRTAHHPPCRRSAHGAMRIGRSRPVNMCLEVLAKMEPSTAPVAPKPSCECHGSDQHMKSAADHHCARLVHQDPGLAPSTPLRQPGGTVSLKHTDKRCSVSGLVTDRTG
jgi:hypothetical protein